MCFSYWNAALEDIRSMCFIQKLDWHIQFSGYHFFMCLYFHKIMYEYILLVIEYCFVLIIATLGWCILLEMLINTLHFRLYGVNFLPIRGDCISCVVIVTPHHTSVQQWDRLLQSPEVLKLNCCCSGCEPHQRITDFLRILNVPLPFSFTISNFLFVFPFFSCISSFYLVPLSCFMHNINTLCAKNWAVKCAW